MKWKNTDPREDIYKLTKIIIIKPSLIEHIQDICLAEVETKHTYNIFTNFKDGLIIKEGEKWDQDWIWTLAPEMK